MGLALQDRAPGATWRQLQACATGEGSTRRQPQSCKASSREHHLSSTEGTPAGCARHPAPQPYLWDGQGEVTEDFKGGGAVATGLALEAAFQLANKEVCKEQGQYEYICPTFAWHQAVPQ